jgi:hypothetical protein
MVGGKAVLVPVLFLEVELCDGHAGYEETAKCLWAHDLQIEGSASCVNVVRYYSSHGCLVTTVHRQWAA